MTFRSKHPERVFGRIWSWPRPGAYICSFHDASWLDYLRLPHSLSLAALDGWPEHYWSGRTVEEIGLTFMDEPWRAADRRPLPGAPGAGVGAAPFRLSSWFRLDHAASFIRRLALAGAVVAALAALLWWFTRPADSRGAREVALGRSNRPSPTPVPVRSKPASAPSCRPSSAGASNTWGQGGRPGEQGPTAHEAVERRPAGPSGPVADSQITHLAAKRVAEACLVAANAEREAVRQASLKPGLSSR